MIPKKVSLENFLSYGPKTVIEFADEEPLWVVNGPNGVGKSALFDAITYCLFAEHRGGVQGRDDLIRHGANGFSVSFEFEFAGTDYRVSRNRAGGKATQSVEFKANGVWARVPNVDLVADVNAWTERTLGLNFKAFTASVLLRQGKAEDILDSQPAQRLDTLKKIIGVERYEALSKRVETARKGKTAARDLLIQQRAAIADVTADDLTTAEAEAMRAARVREAADATRAAATAALPLARQWVALCGKRDDLVRRLEQAAARAADAASIRADHARFVDLSAVLPVLEKLLPLRTSLEDTARQLKEAVERQVALRGEWDQAKQRAEALRLSAATLRQTSTELASEKESVEKQQGRQRQFLKLADDLAELRASAKAFPPTLVDDAAAARDALSRATTAERTAADAFSELTALLKQAKSHQSSFDRVEVGVTCSQCGQVVTAEHAEGERHRLAATLNALTAKRNDAGLAADAAAADRMVVEQKWDQLTKLAAEQDRIRQRLADREGDLTELGGSPDDQAIRNELTRLDAQLVEVQLRHAEVRERHLATEKDLKELALTVSRLEAEVPQAEAAVSEQRTKLAGETATCDSLVAQLPAEWHAVTDIAEHTADRERLVAADIEQQFRELQRDAAVRSEWEGQLNEVERDIAGIPEPGRVPVAEAEQRSRAADTEFHRCDGEHRCHCPAR